MPIKRETLLKKGKPVGTIPKGKTQEKVLSWMRQNPEESFHQGEVADALKIKGPHANNVLRALCKKGLVERLQMPAGPKEPSIYYTLTAKGLEPDPSK